MNQAILKLIDYKIEKILPEEKGYYTVLALNKVLMQLRDEISSLPSDTQWIDVKEVKPNEGCYLAFSDDIMYVTAVGNDCIFWNAGEIVKGVTHYMPLPQSPNN